MGVPHPDIEALRGSEGARDPADRLRLLWPRRYWQRFLKDGCGAVIAYFENAPNTFADLVSGDPADTAIHLPHEPRSITDVRVCDGWGNDRIAFVEVIASFEARDEVGYRTFLGAVASVDDRPRVLMLGDSNSVIPVLQRQAPPFHDDAPAAVLQPPTIMTPDDGATATRMPPASRPMV